MTVWTIEPRDPILFRDGRPFNADPGVRAESTDFPAPSVTAGAVRTRLLLGQGAAQASPLPDADYERLLRVEVRGPLLVELAEDGALRWLAPAPADCIMFGDDKKVRVRRLVPAPMPPGTASPLPSGVLPAAMPTPDKTKPFDGAPRFWHWDKYEAWLLDPADADDADPHAYGHGGAVKEQRTHLQVQLDTQTAQEGYLFQTRALEFQRKPLGATLGGMTRLGLALDTAASLAEGCDVLGGERRLVRWASHADVQLPACPDKLKDRIAADGGCRVLLLTPAFFTHGWRPDWLLQARAGWPLRALQGAAVARPQVVSGWDLRRGSPKASRRLAPAGSVYFLKLAGTPEEIGAWVDAVWLRAVSDDEQARRDGFGLAALGAWTPLA